MLRTAPIICVALFVLAPFARAETPPSDKKKEPAEIAGKSEFLRSVPKHFATLKAVNAAKRQVTLLVEGEMLPKVWILTPDAELKVAGWWARLDHFTVGDRVWAWFATDRAKQPTGIFMLCDELSEQDMHLAGYKVETVSEGTITIKSPIAKRAERVLKTDKTEYQRGKEKGDRVDLKPGEIIFVQSAADRARQILDGGALELRRAAQRETVRKRWLDDGLPGSVSFLHRFTGELELMLDHEAMRWARSLKPGDKVTLPVEPPISCVVRQVKPWRERTQVRLVAAAVDLADLRQGQRIVLKMAAPAAEVENAKLPPDLDQPRSKEERVDWFLASIYCACKVGGDGCTGHFYTLASCNPNACGFPNLMRKALAEKIDRGLTDKQIFEELLNEKGEDLLKPHLLP
jgi:hypothetical protein